MKLKGTEIQQRIAKLTVEAGGIFSAGWGHPVGPKFARRRALNLVDSIDRKSVV